MSSTHTVALTNKIRSLIGLMFCGQLLSFLPCLGQSSPASEETLELNGALDFEEFDDSTANQKPISSSEPEATQTPSPTATPSPEPTQTADPEPIQNLSPEPLPKPKKGATPRVSGTARIGIVEKILLTGKRCEVYLKTSANIGSSFRLALKPPFSKTILVSKVGRLDLEGVWAVVSLPKGVACAQLKGAATTQFEVTKSKVVTQKKPLTSARLAFLDFNLGLGAGISFLEGFHILLPSEKFPNLQVASLNASLVFWPFRVFSSPKKELSRIGIFLKSKYSSVIGKILFDDSSSLSPYYHEMEGGFVYSQNFGTQNVLLTELYISPLYFWEHKNTVGTVGDYSMPLARELKINGSKLFAKIGLKASKSVIFSLGFGSGFFLNGKTNTVSFADALRFESLQKKATKNKFVVPAENVQSSAKIKDPKMFSAALGADYTFDSGSWLVGTNAIGEMISGQVQREQSPSNQITSQTLILMIKTQYQFKKD